jgi:hypothetical protein
MAAATQKCLKCRPPVTGDIAWLIPLPYSNPNTLQAMKPLSTLCEKPRAMQLSGMSYIVRPRPAGLAIAYAPLPMR